MLATTNKQTKRSSNFVNLLFPLFGRHFVEDVFGLRFVCFATCSYSSSSFSSCLPPQILIVIFHRLFFFCRNGTEHTMCRRDGRSTDDSTEYNINRQNGSVSTANQLYNSSVCVWVYSRVGWHRAETAQRAQSTESLHFCHFAQLMPKIYRFQLVVRCGSKRELLTVAFCYFAIELLRDAEFSIWFNLRLGVRDVFFPPLLHISSILCFVFRTNRVWRIQNSESYLIQLRFRNCRKKKDW